MSSRFEASLWADVAGTSATAMIAARMGRASRFENKVTLQNSPYAAAGTIWLQRLSVLRLRRKTALAAPGHIPL
ncbi:hypothetical protein D3C80_2057650 [compost metagenome]